MNISIQCACFAALAYTATWASAGPPAVSLTVGAGFVDPIAFHDATPSFSWKLPIGVQKQTAYRLQVLRGESLEGGTVDGETPSSDSVKWDSGWVDSDDSTFIPYGGQALVANEHVAWRIDYKDENGAASGWSQTAKIQMGLLDNQDWQGSWIRSPKDFDPTVEQVVYFRRGFEIDQPIKSARLHVAARGITEASLNGKPVGHEELGPGWTVYDQRIDALTHDVTEHLSDGENVIGVKLAAGWYAGRIAWRHDPSVMDREPEVLVQLEIELADGTKKLVVSDESWQATRNGPIRQSGIWEGEIYDARLEMPGWDAPGYEDASAGADWQHVVSNAELGAAKIGPKPFAPVRITEEIPAVTLTEPAKGRYVYDFGQNMVGWMALNMPVSQGQTIQVRFAEMLNPDGTIYTDNYRSAKSTNRYTAAETGTIAWRPTFTFHGFRYVEISGLTPEQIPESDWVTALVLHSDLPQIGRFASSHAKLNRLQENIRWGQRGNFLDVPTDCPQRDERFGWTGDAQVFCATAMFNYDSHAFFDSWLGSMRDDQWPDGRIPHIVPNVLPRGAGSPGWMDAATIVPWDVYVRTGDEQILADNYDMMARLVAWYRDRANDGVIRQIAGFGDWLQPNTDDRKGETSIALIGSAFYAKSVKILADTARILDRPQDAQRYQAEADRVRQAFGRYFLDGEGKIQNAKETQTSYVLALEFGLVPQDLLAQTQAHLLRTVDEAGGHLRTGFLGTPYVAKVIDQAGRPDIAYDMLFKETYPSWFFSINQGATTMWERWDSYTHEQGFHPQSMNSFNHYAYGAIGQWMYERIAGLSVDPEHPGYKHFYVRPVIGGPLTSARAELETPYGLAVSAWVLEDNQLSMQVVVPPNTTATIEFPSDRDPETVGPGNYAYVLDSW